MMCGPHRQLQMHQSEMKLSAWTCGLRHFRHCGNSEGLLSRWIASDLASKETLDSSI
jgi:hypothetical protein